MVQDRRQDVQDELKVVKEYHQGKFDTIVSKMERVTRKRKDIEKRVNRK